MISRSAIFTALFAGVLAVSASASYQAPAPAKIVSPTELPRSYRGATVTVRLTVDAAGRPSDILVVGERDAALVRQLTAAVSQWRFSPALRDGVAVSSRIALPLELVEE